MYKAKRYIYLSFIIFMLGMLSALSKDSRVLAKKQTEKPAGRLKPVENLKLTRYETKKIKVSWKTRKYAGYYRVYYSKEKKGRYRLAGVTKEDHFLVTGLKNDTKYYFYVQSCMKREKDSPKDSEPSEKLGMTTRTFQRKTLFAGDSITEGINIYGRTFPNMNIGGIKKAIAYRGLNTITFRTNGVFDGKTGLEKVIGEKPYRVYFMLGMNEIHYRKYTDMITEYEVLIKEVKKACPDTDIVLCAVSPVSYGQRQKHSGFWQISAFNRQLKKLAGKLGVRYCDYTDFLKDSSGYLKSEYATGDGLHWQIPAYEKFGSVIEKFDKELDM